jgi:acetyl esterase/lipase
MTRISRRQLGSGALAVAAFASVRCASAVVRSARPHAVDPLSLVDPDLRVALLKIQPEIDKEIYTARTLPTLRKLTETWAKTPRLAPPFTLRSIPGAKGAPDVQIYIVGQRSAKPRPAILYIHGGGYILGRASYGIADCQKMAAKHDCLVVSVDYRLAPETRFPGALEDNYTALAWIHDNADELGVDRKRIAVMGESAGGGHAAALVIAARDRGDIPVCAQILIYPMLDDRTGSSRHPAPWIGTFIWNRAANRFGWTSLLGMPAGAANVPEGAVPARVRDLSGLPPTFIGVGSIDLFVNENIEYALRLLDAGVKTDLIVVAGAYHGFYDIVPNAPVSMRFLDAVDRAISNALMSSEALSNIAQ